MKLLSSLLLLMVVGGVVPPAIADDTAEVQQWLTRMSDALRSKNYDGTFIYQHDDVIDTMRIIHIVSDGAERERLISLNGSAREVIRTDDSVTFIMPDKKTVWIDRRSPQATFRLDFPMDLDTLSPFYKLTMGERSRVAGLMVQEVLIIPRDRYRRGYRLFLEIDTALPMSKEFMESNGELLERILFTRLDILESIDPRWVEPKVKGESYTWKIDSDETETGTDLRFSWRVKNVPVGFTVDARHRRMSADRSSIREQLVFSDGLSSFSVYVEPLVSNTLEGHTSVGSISAFGSKDGQYQVTVVGEVPAHTVELVGTSVIFNEENKLD
jgi:sigma-E factor negative regulatory protein RseB